MSSTTTTNTSNVNKKSMKKIDEINSVYYAKLINFERNQTFNTNSKTPASLTISNNDEEEEEVEDHDTTNIYDDIDMEKLGLDQLDHYAYDEPKYFELSGLNRKFYNTDSSQHQQPAAINPTKTNKTSNEQLLFKLIKTTSSNRNTLPWLHNSHSTISSPLSSISTSSSLSNSDETSNDFTSLCNTNTNTANKTSSSSSCSTSSKSSPSLQVKRTSNNQHLQYSIIKTQISKTDTLTKQKKIFFLIMFQF